MDFRGRDQSKQVDIGIGINFGVENSQIDNKNVLKPSFVFQITKHKLILTFQPFVKSFQVILRPKSMFIIWISRRYRSWHPNLTLNRNF